MQVGILISVFSMLFALLLIQLAGRDREGTWESVSHSEDLEEKWTLIPNVSLDPSLALPLILGPHRLWSGKYWSLIFQGIYDII